MIKTLLAGLLAATFLFVGTAPDAQAHKRGYAHKHKSGVVVRAPHTRVRVNKRKRRTRVRAPYTNVTVDRRRRHVRIRVPYFSGNIAY